MGQFDYIKDIAKFGLQNNQNELLSALNGLISHCRSTKKNNIALQLQSIVNQTLKEKRSNKLVKIDPSFHQANELDDLILEKLVSDYRLTNLVCSEHIEHKLKFFIKEHTNIEDIRRFDLPVSNKVLFFGPSGCGKTLASYVLAGELDIPMLVVNLGAIVSSKLGETSKNLASIFKMATIEKSIIFIDEFDTVGKIRNYDQDHGEMKRVVNTILQLFDYLPQSNIIIAATNQVDMVDNALLRRFDLKLELDLPDKDQIKKLVNKVANPKNIIFDKPQNVDEIISEAVGLSYYSIQKTLITAIKQSLLNQIDNAKAIKLKVNIDTWSELILEEKQ